VFAFTEAVNPKMFTKKGTDRQSSSERVNRISSSH